MKYTCRQLGVVWLTIVAVQPVSCFVSPGSSVTTSKPSLDLRHKPPLKIVPSTSSQLHSVAPEIWTSFLPPAMGFVKSEWTVSYGYGFATSLSALSLLKRIPITTDNPIFPLQAAALIFYGLRLNAFLFIRNRISSRMQEFQKSMEERASARGSRIGRAPIVVSCGLLYYALFSPLLLTAMVGGSLKVPSVAMLAMKGLVGMQWIGFLMGAVGDFTKSYVKKSENDEKFLVTSGIFSLLRHPNYTGEIIAWTCNSLLGAIAGGYLLRSKLSSKIAGSLGLNLIGWIGIVFVLLGATGNLEDRQKRDYGDTDKYKKWVGSTWSGWYLPKQTKTAEPHEIIMDDEMEEESGSGI